MQTKLTLSLDKDVIEQAKAYARKQGISLSKMVQDFLQEKANHPEDMEEIEVPKEFEGVFGAVKLPKNFDYEKAKEEYLRKKYL